jgi:hypothetical protein
MGKLPSSWPRGFCPGQQRGCPCSSSKLREALFGGTAENHPSTNQTLRTCPRRRKSAKSTSHQGHKSHRSDLHPTYIRPAFPSSHLFFCFSYHRTLHRYHHPHQISLRRLMSFLLAGSLGSTILVSSFIPISFPQIPPPPFLFSLHLVGRYPHPPWLLFGLNNGSVNIPHVAYFFLLVNNANLYVWYQQVLADPKPAKKSLWRLAAEPVPRTKSCHSGSSSFSSFPSINPA